MFGSCQGDFVKAESSISGVRCECSVGYWKELPLWTLCTGWSARFALISKCCVFFDTIKCQIPPHSDMSATDSLSREFFKLKRLRLKSNVSTCIIHNTHSYMYHTYVVHMQYDSSKLSNVLKVESLHSTLCEEEAVYWSQYFVNSIHSLRQSNSRQKHQRRYMYMYIL